jgi:hypothetical protein
MWASNGPPPDTGVPWKTLVEPTGLLLLAVVQPPGGTLSKPSVTTAADAGAGRVMAARGPTTMAPAIAAISDLFKEELLLG